MSRRIQALTASEVARLINEQSSDESDAEPAVDEGIEQHEDSEGEDVLHAYADDEAADEVPDEEHRTGNRELTKSQKSFTMPHDPSSAGPYEAYGPRQSLQHGLPTSPRTEGEPAVPTSGLSVLACEVKQRTSRMR